MKRSGVKLAIAALCLGVLIGLGIQAFKAYVAETLSELLSKEANKACGCTFKADSTDVSLLTLSASAHNARIESNGHKALWFKTVRVGFGLGQIREHLLFIDLNLVDGASDGITGDSPTVRFISSLASPPENDYPGRWKLKLRKLFVRRASFDQKLPDGDLRGEEVSLDMVRDPQTNFNMKPSIKKLSLVMNSGDQGKPKTYVLGNATANLYLQDNQLDLHPVLLALTRSTIEGSGSLLFRGGDAWSGAIRFLLDAQSLPIESRLAGALQGNLVLSGPGASPAVQGAFNLPPNSTLAIPIGSSAITAQTLHGNISAAIAGGTPKIEISNLAAQSGDLQMRAAEPFILDGDKLSGRTTFTADTLDLGPVSIRGLSGNFSLSGTAAAPLIRSQSDIKALVVNGTEIPGFNVDFTGDSKRLAFTLLRQDQGKDILRAAGAVRFDGGTPQLEPTTITMSDLPIGKSPKEPYAQISATADVQGPANLSDLEAQGTVTLKIVNSGQALTGTLALKHGLLSVKQSGFENAAQATALIDFTGAKESSLAFTANDLRLSSFNPALDCSAFSGTLQYNFAIASPAAGSGSLALDGAQIGCEPYAVRLVKPAKLPIQRGVVTIPGIAIASQASSMAIRGDISVAKGFNVMSDGHLELAALTGFLPSVDNISGTTHATVAVSGPLDAPVVDGHISLDNGAFWIESAGIAAERVQGTVDIDTKQITIKNVSGDLNSGSFAISGTILPFDLDKSVLDLSMRQVTFDRGQNATLTFSGDISLKRANTGLPVVGGTINLDSGEFRQKFDLPTIIRMISENVLERSRVAVHDESLPNLTVDVRIIGQRNLFLLTDFASAEIAVDVSVAGSLSNPTLNGEIKTLSGWVGLKNRRFDITSGIVNFNPTSSTPTLSLLGETYLPSYTGEYNLVLLEVRGTPLNPIFKLTSDQGLSEPQILALLAQSGTALSQTRANSIAGSLEGYSNDLYEPDRPFDLRRLLHTLTHIDSLSIEPIYNQQTAAIEPALVAEKHLTRRLSLRGESTFGGTDSVSRAKAVYDLTRVLSLEGLVYNDPTRRTTPAETNLVYTILARQTQFLSIAIHGNKHFNALDVLEAMRISETSRVPESNMPALEASVRDFYNANAYRAAAVHSACEAENGFCRKITFDIDEGPRSSVGSIAATGDSIAGVFNDKTVHDLTSVPPRQRATAQFLEEKRTAWVQRLRSEGYIGARVYPSYVASSTEHHVDLSIDVALGKPVSFTFEGNTVFSAEHFLDSIDLFKRKQPFGNNTISILVNNIVHDYRVAGYLYATVSYEKQEDARTGRLNYLITIIEDRRAKVSGVVIAGLETVPERKIKEKITKNDPVLAKAIFKPRAAVAEDLDLYARQIQQILIEAGLPDATVTPQTIPDESGDTVEIRYVVQEGAPLRVPSIAVEGLPAEVSQPRMPELPCSIVQTNEYIDSILNAVQDAGFIKAAISIDSNPASNSIAIHVDPGARTIIGAITVQGNSGIAEATILKHLAVHTGDPWVLSKLDDSRRALLRLGLFSRVDIGPADGKLEGPAENLVVTVVERPRQTLEVGGGANSEYGLHAFGEASDRGLFADGRTLTARFDTYWDLSNEKISQGVGNLRYADPTVFDTPYTFTEDARFQRLALTTLPYNLDRTSLASYLSRTHDSGVTYSFGHTIQLDNLSDVDPGAVISDLDTGNVRLSFVSGTLSYDHRDNPLNPHSGYYTSLEYKFSSEALGSQADFQALSAHASAVQPIPLFDSRLHLAINGRIASAWAFGATSEVPITERYFLGGATTVRGYKENSLGPRGMDGSVIGGDFLVLENTELRYTLTDPFAVHLFWDTGNVFLKDRSTSISDLRFGTGIGLRYLSPVGPIGVDIGHPIARRPGESELRVNFTIGNAF